MTMTHDYGKLHQAVDRLEPEQAQVVLDMVQVILGDPVDRAVSSDVAPPTQEHRFSFTGIFDGPGDMSERKDKYLEGFGEPRS